MLLKLVDATIGLRVTEDEEEIGLDLTQHGERGYIMGANELLGLHEVGHSASSAPVHSHANEPVGDRVRV